MFLRKRLPGRVRSELRDCQMCGVAGVLDLAGLRMVPEEIIPHVWEENQEGMFEQRAGMFLLRLGVRSHDGLLILPVAQLRNWNLNLDF